MANFFLVSYFYFYTWCLNMKFETIGFYLLGLVACAFLDKLLCKTVEYFELWPCNLQINQGIVMTNIAGPSSHITFSSRALKIPVYSLYVVM